ncbi:MAG: phosphotransferase enzyme family protein [Christensenellales bacterium]|jgi:Ser/Thr protein kinase RdoA (MazF antagonist)
MYTEKELRKILENWDVEKGLKIEGVQIADGTKASESVWKVGRELYLKTNDRERLLKNLKVVRALLHQGLSAAVPVPTRSGADFLDGEAPFVLTRGLKGCPLPKGERFGENRIVFGRKYGQSIARLHKALKAIQKDVSTDAVDLYQNVADWALPAVRKQNMGIEERFFEDYIDVFGRLYEVLPKQLIHRDPNPGNILFHEGEVSGFIDFDLSEASIRLWDVCYCATGILSEAGDAQYEPWFDILRGILEGYDTENPLTREEKQSVLYVLCSIPMICIAYFEGRGECRELAEANRKMLTFLIENRSRICSSAMV